MTLVTFDINKFDIEEVRQIHDNILKQLPKDEALIMIPRGINLIEDISIDELLQMRKILDTAIETKEKEDLPDGIKL